MAVHRSFGLDLSGYASSRSGLAEVVREEGNSKYRAYVYRDHPFALVAAGRDRLADVIARQREALTRLLKLGDLLIDIPIDLQDLPSSHQPVFVWQLTARAVDFAYGGLRPLADRIGAPVARFKNLLSELDGARITTRHRTLTPIGKE